jgi:TolA-binding protein
VTQLQYACVQYNYEKLVYKKRVQAFEKKGSKGKAPRVNHRKSTNLINGAKASLASANRKKKVKPKAMYYYGLALALANDALAVNVFDKLMTKYPKHKLTPKANLALGDYYLDTQQVQNANSEYKNAIRHGKNSIKLYAKYKQAWIKFALGLNEKNINKQRSATSDLVRVQQRAKIKKYKSTRLAEIIKEDILDILASMGSISTAKQILRRINGMDVYFALLKRMAEEKIGQGNIPAAYSLYVSMIREQRYSPAIPSTYQSLIVLAAQMDKANLVLKHLTSMVKQFANPRSSWSRKQKTKDQKAGFILTETLLHDYATTFDQQGTSQKNTNYLKTADKLYSMYLKYLPKEKRAYDIQYYYAQLLFQQNNFKRSALILRDLLKKKPKGKLTKDASDLMAIAAQSYVDQDQNKYTLPEAGMANQVVKLPLSRKVYIECSKTYAKLRPKSSSTPTLLFTSGTYFFEFGHYREANKQYIQYIKRAPDSEFAVTAAIRILFTAKRSGSKKMLNDYKKKIAKFSQIRSQTEIASYYAKPKKKKRRSKKKSRPKQDAPALSVSTNSEAEDNENWNENQENQQEDDWNEVDEE